MTQEHMTELVAGYQADEAFKAALDAATSAEDAVRIATDHGYTITVDDPASSAKTGRDLSDAELEALAGGYRCSALPTPTQEFMSNVVSINYAFC